MQRFSDHCPGGIFLSRFMYLEETHISYLKHYLNYFSSSCRYELTEEMDENNIRTGQAGAHCKFRGAQNINVE